MKAKKKMSLKWRIFAAFSAIMLMILALLWLCQTVFLNGFYKRVKVYACNQAAQTTVDNFGDENFSYLIASQSNAHDVSIRVLDNRFRCVYEASAQNARSFFKNIPDSEFYTFYEKAKENGGTYSEYFEGFSAQKSDAKSGGRKNSFVVSKLVADASGNIYTVIVDTDITPVDSVITTLRVILIVVTVLTVLAALVTALVLSAGLTKPIKKISEKAKELATGDYTVEFEPSSIKEIDELSDALNYTKTELGKIDTLQKELVANISHDLRTPLTLISGYAEVMRDIPGEITDENLQVIIDESNRLTSLVNDVLDISKFSAGVQQMQFDSFDFIACIESVIPRYNKLIEKDNYRIRFDCGALTAAPVYADRGKILQVLYNLINNAVSYTGKDKTVSIRLSEDNGVYTVHILDSGEGIAPDKLPYIWDRYYKVDKNHRRAQMGSGLGLSIVKQILDAHNASYGVNSTPGEGSDFWFSLVKETAAEV